MLVAAKLLSKDRAEFRGGLVVIGFAALLLVAWSFAVPIFESPDEAHHGEDWTHVLYGHRPRGGVRLHSGRAAGAVEQMACRYSGLNPDSRF